MISMPMESKTIRFVRKSTPLMVILIAGHICFVHISATVMFAAAEHLASASGTAAVASEIEGATFASASTCDSSAVV
jgi:hypothetical protein